MTTFSHWEKTENPKLWSRTNIQYSKMKLSDLEERGLGNPYLTQLMANLPFGAFIAGGFLTNIFKGVVDKDSDIDLFFDGSDSLNKTLRLFKNPPANAPTLQGYAQTIPTQEFIDKKRNCRFYTKGR